MKSIIAIAGLTILSSVAMASDKVMGNNPDMYGSPLLEHEKGEKAHAIQKGKGDSYGSQLIRQPADHSDKSEPHDPSENDPEGHKDVLPKK